MEQATASSELNEDIPVERFRNTSQAWLVFFLATLMTCYLFAMICIRIAVKTPIFSKSLLADLLCLSGLAAVVIVPLVVISIGSFTSEIRVGREFLTWTARRKTNRARWSEVLDFYESAQPNRAGYIIKTAHGDCRFLSSLSRFEVLKSLVTERAVNARVKQWNLLGARPEADGWPKTFGYDTPLHRWGAMVCWFIFYASMIVLLICFGASAWNSVVMVASEVGWGWGAAFIGIGIACVLYPFGPIFMHCPGLAELRKRRGQTIRLSEDGIRYQDETRMLNARWDEITSLTYGSFRRYYAVGTLHGSFDFRATIQDCRILTRAIEAMASESAPSGWKPTYRERFDSPTRPGIDPSGSSGVRVFSYRTREMRAMLMLPIAPSIVEAFLCAMPSMHVANHASGLCGSGSPVLPGFLVLTSGWSLYALMTYFVSGIQTDAEGMTQRAIFASKRILWTDVANFRKKSEDVSVASTEQRIQFSMMIADYRELLAEITTRTGKDLEIV